MSDYAQEEPHELQHLEAILLVASEQLSDLDLLPLEVVQNRLHREFIDKQVAVGVLQVDDPLDYSVFHLVSKIAGLFIFGTLVSPRRAKTIYIAHYCWSIHCLQISLEHRSTNSG